MNDEKNAIDGKTKKSKLINRCESCFRINRKTSARISNAKTLAIFLHLKSCSSFEEINMEMKNFHFCSY